MAPIRFGFLLIDYQVIDVVGPLDLLSSSSRAIVQELETAGILQPGLKDKAVDIEYHHIGETMGRLPIYTHVPS